MNDSNLYLAFSLDDRRFGLPLSLVERVVWAVELAPFPGGPETALGVANLQGRVIPVLSVRRRLRMPDRPMDLGDRIIVAQVSGRTVGLLVDAVSGVLEPSAQQVVARERIANPMEYVAGVARLEDGLIFLIGDLEGFLGLRATPEEVMKGA